MGVPTTAPGPTNVVIVSKIPEGTSEHQLGVAASGGRSSEVLQITYRPADDEGPGWALIAFATPGLAQTAKERMDGKPLPQSTPPMPGQVVPPSPPIEAAMGEGLYGPLKRASDEDSPWKETRSPQGQIYWYHKVTRQTTWIKPAPEFPSIGPGVVPPPGKQGAGVVRPPGMPAMIPGANPGAAAAQAQAAINAAKANSATAAAQADALSAGPVGANLFVYHIPNNWDDNILKQHFEHFGQILSCRVQKDGDGRPRGFGFISFDSAPAASAAIAGMHGFPVEGKWLKVQLKKGDEQQMLMPGSGPASTDPLLAGAPPPPGGAPYRPY